MPPDVLVVGGGIVGCSAAYYLARRGRSVTLVERDAPGAHASGFAYGVLLRRPDSPVDPVAGLSALSARLHEDLGQSLREETGIETGYRRKDSLMLARSPEEASALRPVFDWLRRHHDGEVRWLETNQAQVIEPRLGPGARAAVYSDTAHELDPHSLTTALWRAAEQRGAVLRTGEVTGLVRDGDAVAGVVMDGDPLEAGAVVLAAGPWTHEAAGWIGIEIPVAPLKGQILRLSLPGEPVRASIWWDGDYATSKPDGLIWVGTTEEHAGFDESPTIGARNRIMASVVQVLPSLADATVARHTACLRPVAPDGFPIIGEVPGRPGAYVATGGGRSGIQLGPGMGHAVADLVCGEQPLFDLAPFSLERFSRGRPR